MTLYYTLVFLILMGEMGLFLLLVIPFPYNVKRKIFTFLSENPIIAKIQYGLKITFIFILVLFIDSVNRVYRVQVELHATAENVSNGAAILGRERLEVQARKFYSQRNMYLCGFTLFLSLILNRTYSLIIDVLHLEEKLKSYEGPSHGQSTSAKIGKTGAASSSAAVAAATGDSDTIFKLRKELELKEQDIATLKKQAAGLQKEYSLLSDKYAATQPSGEKKLL